MANIRLKELVEANVDPKLVARSKETGKLVYFKNAQNKDAAMKAGTHLDPKDKKGDEPKADAKPNDMFAGDYAKDRGGDASKDSDIADFNEPKARKQIIKDRNKLVQMNVGKDDKSLDFAIKLIDMLLDGELQAPNADTTKVGKEEPKTSSKLSTMMPKSKPTLNINSKNWKNTDGDGRMSFDAADDVRNHLNAVLGTDDGVAEVDFGSGNIQYSLSDGENSIYVGNDGGTYNVSFEGPSMDLDKIEQSYKSFKNPKDALQYAGELAKANKEGLEQKQDTGE
jgi:hypothetical protein